MNILIVDDSKTMRHIQKQVLATLAPRVDFSEAGDGIGALLAMTESRFNLVVIDWTMPNMNGQTLVEKIRERDQTTPLLVCATHAEKTQVLAIVRGAIDYILKPFTPDMLLAKAQQSIQSARRSNAA
ncbi:MAG TPA: response regulator [Tepidisphaeraceae bacterium]|nr:response regulator [Tepidisphaeraceae bacterium]